MVTIEQLKTDIHRLERNLFFHSLQPIEIEELEQMQEKVRDLKEAFLGTCFEGNSVAELEEIRFKIAEISYSIIISLIEELYLNIVDDVRNLENLYRTA